MTDRFDEMAGRVQMDLAAFAMPTGTSARRVIADALRAAHAGGVDEAAATIDLSMDDARELRRLALLGLERDERQAVTSEQAAKDIKILEQIHAKSWDEAVALRHAAEALSERAELYDRIIAIHEARKALRRRNTRGR